MRSRTRTSGRTRSFSTCFFAAAATSLTSFLGVPAKAQENRKPAPIQTLLVMERSDFSDFLVDPKDQRLKLALSMLPDRIGELPGEAPDFDANGAAAIKLILATISRSGRVGITVNAGNPADGLFGYGIAISAFAKDEADAQELHAKVKAALKDVPLPPAPGGQKRFATMDDTQLPGAIGRLSFGPRKTADGWRYEIIAGALDNPDLAWDQIPAPSSKDIKPVVRGRIDLAGLNNVVNLLAAFAGPQNPQVGEGIRRAGEYGLYGTNAIKARFEYGYTERDSVGRLAVENASNYADRYALSHETLTEADYAIIPSDATMASVSRADLTLLKRAIEAGKQANPELGPGLEHLKQLTGVDLVTDVLDTLGGTIAYYTSDATGGGSIASLVAMISIKDRVTFTKAHEKFVTFANQAALAAQDAGKYARIVAWKEAGVPVMSLKFAGLPIPFEFSYSLTDRWLVAGLTPQAVVAAVRQTASSGRGLLAHPRIAELAEMNKLTSVTYIDTARMMHAGYPVASMIGSAVGNAARTPAFVSKESDRDPGMVTPVFHELAKDALPSVMTTHWDGDAYVVETHTDRSVLVGAAGYSGALMQLVVPIGVIAAAADARKKSQQHDRDDDMKGPEGDDGDAQSMYPSWRTNPDVAVAFLSRDPVMGMVLTGVFRHPLLTP